MSKLTEADLISMIRADMGENPEPGEHVFRCRAGVVPFAMPAQCRTSVAPTEPAAPTTPAVDGAPAPQEAREAGKPANRKTDAEDHFLLRGRASSTSVDWYGTEMSVAALEDMRNQFSNGVDLFPRHGGFLDSVEWDEVIGRTFQGILRSADVVNPADISEQGFVLDIEARVSRAAPRADLLEKRLESDQPIGLSIGGWFLEVRYITDDDGELARIIVERVQLDHVAVVRSPANPDSMGLELLRSAGAAVFRSAPVPAVPPTSEPVTEPTAEAVTRDQALDTPPDPGDDAGATSGASPDSRSQTMSAEKMDQILSLLQDIQTGQERNTTRLTSLEARSETPTTPTPAPEPAPEAVTADAIARAVADGIARASAAATPKAPEAPPAPSEDPSVRALREQVEALQAEVRNRDEAMASVLESGRSGRSVNVAVSPVLGGGTDADLAKRELAFLVKESRKAAPVLSVIAERHEGALTLVRQGNGHLPSGADGEKHFKEAQNAASLLRSLCVAAERDNLIGDFTTGWRL